MDNFIKNPASFRDPSGFVYEKNGQLFRQVNKSYAEDYDLLMRSGLYKKLIDQNKLVAHIESNENIAVPTIYYKILQPEKIPFISYPFEWCFEQLQDAALETLEITRLSIEHGLILKDANPYNIQFKNNHPILIDTLSFEKYDETIPWVAYRQFSESFLYPLLLAHYTLAEVHRIFFSYPEGIAANIVKSLLPIGAKFKIANWLHVFLPAMVTSGSNKSLQFSKSKMERLLQHLTEFVKNLSPYKTNGSWKNYYTRDISSPAYLENKTRIFTEILSPLEIKEAVDLGCNEGLFSGLLAQKGVEVLAIDNDPALITSLYRKLKTGKEKILPLVADIANPPSDSGFNNKERLSLLKRIRTNCIIALALIHHLCISKNISFSMLAEFFAMTNKFLLIEFIPKEDEKVQLLLENRKDIFQEYNETNFRSAFSKLFTIRSENIIEPTGRKIFLMEKINQ